MGNFKVKVNSEAESKEVQDLLVKMGYHARKNWTERNPIHESIQAWSDGEFTFSLNHNQVPVGFKEITLAELRDMVVLKRNDVADATHESSIYKYFKGCDDWYYFDLGCTDKWQKSSGAKPEYYEKLKPIEKTMNILDTGRYEQPSLNDQYAEIEQVRQHKKHEHNSSAWGIQIGGDHYKQFHIQPMQFALENKLDAAQQNVIKYIMRHSFKNGKQDLEKAKHYIDLMIEFYYGENNNG